MIKAIFFDIDETLISKNHPQISGGVVNALKCLREKGIKLFIASGRHALEIEELGINDKFIFDGYLTLNGGYCYNQKEVIYKNPINKEDIARIVSYVDEHNLACSFVESNDLYVNLVNDYVVEAQKSINTSIPPVKDAKRALENDVYQVNPFVGEEDVIKLTAELENCKYTKWHDGAYDLIAKNGGKQEGIKAVLKYYDIKLEETMAFGDGHNDVDMLKLVSIGVCMANGHPETIACSDYVTDTVDNDGIVSALKHFKLID